MRIVIDSREREPYEFKGKDCETVTGTLMTGDYSLFSMETLVSVERKSLDDLIMCLTTERGRFEKELARSRGYEYFTVLIEANLHDLANGNYRSKMLPHSALQSVFAMMQRYRVPFLFAGNRKGAEYSCFWLLEKFLREKTICLENILKLQFHQGKDAQKET